MLNLHPIYVKKASGDTEQFNESKFVKSLASTGLTVHEASDTFNYLKGHLKTGITTKDIHDHVTSYLRENAPASSYFNYGLKRAVMDLGPSGHPFENLISEVLRIYGYKTEVSVEVLGKCVTHEVDVIAGKENQKYFIECKFHNTPGIKTDVQVALYCYARYLDIKTAMELRHDSEMSYYSWLITNTKVTSEVLDYAKCVGLELTSWTYPTGHGLSDLLMASGLHPITLMYEMPKRQLYQLLERGIISCSSLKRAVEDERVSDILTPSEQKHVLDRINSCSNLK